MEFKDIVAVSGKPGLYELVKTRQDGLIVRHLSEETKSFVSNRKHSFTPLENVGIYQISGDTVELTQVFNEIAKQGGNRPISTASADELRQFFELVLPDFDEEKVKRSDIKKIMQWYEVLEENDLIEILGEATGEEE